MSEFRLRYSRSRNLVGLCVLLTTLPVAFIRVLLMYSSPEVSDHDMRNIRPPASALLLQGSTTPTLKTNTNSTDQNTTAAAKSKLASYLLLALKLFTVLAMISTCWIQQCRFRQQLMSLL